MVTKEDYFIIAMAKGEKLTQNLYFNCSIIHLHITFYLLLEFSFFELGTNKFKENYIPYFPHTFV